jgi:hypothetical protein
MHWLRAEHRTELARALQLGKDSKRGGCDLVPQKVRDACHREEIGCQAIAMKQNMYRRPAVAYSAMNL